MPLIQYTLDRLWLQREGRVLTARAYEQLGGVGGALQQKADGIIDGLSDAEQRQVRRLMTRLVELGEEGVSTRRRVELTAVEPTDAEARAIFHDVLAQLVDARLLVRNDDAGATTIEVAHEALIRKWPRMSRWIEEDRDKIGQLETLEGWAREAAEQRSLLVGAQLGYATQVVARYPEDVDGRTIALVTASRARARRRQGALIGAVVLFAALGVVALILWQSSSANAVAAEQSAAEAKTSAELADARAAEARRAQQAADKAGMRVRDGMRLSAAIGLEPGAPGLSMGLLREFEVEPPRAALGHAVLTARWSEQLQLTGHAGAVKSARFSSDGARVVTACEDGKVRVWSAHDGALLVDREVGPIGFALFRPDGAQILSALDDGTVHLWDGDPGHEDLILGSHEPRPADVTGGVSGPITIAVYSPDGAQVFTVRDENDRVQVWDARTGNEGPQIPAAQAVSVDFDRDARRVLVADRTGATVWDRSNLAVVTTLD
ncbi:MAG: hypothetical protein KC636_25425, partial [Myxococcales bacterium]|nr:hypothetical protein [Myxococcales bacterium]